MSTMDLVQRTFLPKGEHPLLVPLQCASVFTVAFLFFSVVVPGVWYDGGFPAVLKAAQVENVRFDTFETIIARDGSVTKFATCASLVILAVVVASVIISLHVREKLERTLSKLQRVALHFIITTFLQGFVFSFSWVLFSQSFRGQWGAGFDYAYDFFPNNGERDFAWCAAVVHTIAFAVGSGAAVWGDEFKGIFPQVANKMIGRVLATFILTWIVFRWAMNPLIIRAIAVKIGFRTLPFHGDLQDEMASELDQFATLASATHVVAFVAGTLCCHMTKVILQAAASKSSCAARNAVSVLTALATWGVIAGAATVVFWSCSIWFQYASSNGIEFVHRYQSVAFDHPASFEATGVAACSLTLWFLFGALTNEVQSIPNTCARVGDRIGVRREEKLGKAAQRIVDSQAAAKRREREYSLIAPLLMAIITVSLMLAVADPRLLGTWIAHIQSSATWVSNLLPTFWEYMYDNFSRDQLFFMTLPVLLLTEIPLYFFTVLDILKLKSLDKYRIHYAKIDHKRPRRYPSNDELWKCWIVHCKNFFGGYCGTFFVGVGLAIKLGIYPYTFTREIPDYWVLEFLVISFLSDCLFYWFHRLMHHPRFYKKMHKLHHEWVYTISLAHHYMEFEEALLFMLPPILPAMLFRTHIAVVWLYMFWAQFNGILGHSAFMLPVLSKVFQYLPTLRPDYHDLHHLRFNVNYGATYTFTDKIFGTYRYEPIIYVDGIDPMLVQDGLTETDPFAHSNMKDGGYTIVGGEDDTSVSKESKKTK